MKRFSVARNIECVVGGRCADEIASSAERLLSGRPGRYIVFNGFCDVHVHLREPGFSYKETIRSGTLAAARGGYTLVCPMPNLDPVPDSAAHLRVQTDLIHRDAAVGVVPFGALTVGEKGGRVADLEAMAPDVAGFSDDGRGVQSEAVMREAMRRAAALGKIVSAHCETDGLTAGGYIHDGAYAAAHGHRPNRPESEYTEVERDIRLAAETGCALHVCHVSCAESVERIRAAKARGENVSCETAPHYLLLTDEMLREDGRFRMNPPIRSASDRDALVRALADGTVDAVATDHAPHAAWEKDRGLADSLSGVVGLETAFPALYTGLVRTEKLGLERLAEALTEGPRRRFGFPETADFCVWELERDFTVDPAEFLSMGRATPFAGMRLWGRCAATVCGGRLVWNGLEAAEKTIF